MAASSFRLPAALLEQIEKAAGERGVTRSEVVREALVEYAARRQPATTGQLVDSLLPARGSGKGNLAADGERILRKRFSARRRSR